jgi:chromate reductase, NAD(P)H dehydrogenase (quinone)
MVALVGICGSLRKASLNRALLRAVAETLPEGTTIELVPANGIDLPIFNSDHQHEPEAVISLKAAIAAADGVVFAVPEYNYSIPGGLKNALDWISRPPPKSPLRGKPCALVGAASGMSGTIRAQTHMRNILVYSDAPCLLQPEILIPRAQDRFDAEGNLTDESTRQLLQRFGIQLAAFVARNKLG